MDFLVIGGGTQWREGKVRPLPGSSPHDRLVSRGISFSFWRTCDDPFPATPFAPWPGAQPKRTAWVFQAWRNLSGPMESETANPTLGGTVPPPAGRPRAQVAERAGRSALPLIVRR